MDPANRKPVNPIQTQSVPVRAVTLCVFCVKACITVVVSIRN